jgi:hypothetical protein
MRLANHVPYQHKPRLSSLQYLVLDLLFPALRLARISVTKPSSTPGVPHVKWRHGEVEVLYLYTEVTS